VEGIVGEGVSEEEDGSLPQPDKSNRIAVAKSSHHLTIIRSPRPIDGLALAKVTPNEASSDAMRLTRVFISF